jgi:hypothetical protein
MLSLPERLPLHQLLLQLEAYAHNALVCEAVALQTKLIGFSITRVLLAGTGTLYKI